MNQIPRELRDLIYQHVVKADYIYVGPQYLINKGPPCENERNAYHWNVRYVRQAILVELVQIWYGQSMFYFWDTKRNNEVIKSFMTSDRWGLGINPFEYISKVKFDLVDDVLHYHQLGETRAKCTVATQHPVRMTAPLKVFAGFRFPSRVKFTICIHTFGGLKSGCLSSIDLHHTLDEILKDLRMLHKAGYGFTVQWYI